jgi:cation:H+ antiporter
VDLLLDIFFIVAGLALLTFGGEALVRGASTLALKLRISPLIIGLVVVSAATSAPELAVTVGSVFNGEPDLAIGNVIGSNIANILLILGLAAVISPLLIQRQLVRFDIPVMLGASALLLLLSLDGRISQLDGSMLLLLLVAHATVSVVISRRGRRVKADELPEVPLITAKFAAAISLVLLVAGVGMLVGGSQLLVIGAVSLATDLGVSSLVIGLTVVAIGTSLPELATSIIAIRKGETDMAVGNVVGSNLFNIGMVLGLPALLFEGGLPVAQGAVAIDLPLMLAASVALLPIAFTGFVIARWEGAVFLTLYFAYLTYLVLDSTGHDASQGFTTAMLWLVLPLLGASLLALTAFELGVLRERKRLAAKLD